MLWLALENKLITWETSLRRGWIGPSSCDMCRNREESTTHLFVQCSFAKHVKFYIASYFKLKEDMLVGCTQKVVIHLFGFKIHKGVHVSYPHLCILHMVGHKSLYLSKLFHSIGGSGRFDLKVGRRIQNRSKGSKNEYSYHAIPSEWDYLGLF